MRQFIVIGLMLLSASWSWAADGMINVKSVHSVKQTADKLEKILAGKGMKIFIRVNHAQGAQKVGQTLRPTELILFGNPKVGTPLMLCQQSVAIDLPQKALIWEDDTGQVWLSYNDPRYLAARHNIADCDPVLLKIETALGNFAKAATAP